MTSPTTVQFDSATLAGLDRLLELLLPGTNTLPAGRQVVEYLDLLGRVFGADPSLEGPVVDLARRAATEADDLDLETIESWGGDAVETVVHALHAAYYMSRDVMRALNYPGQGRHPISEASPEERVSDDLLAPVRERGPVFVDVSTFDTQH